MSPVKGNTASVHALVIANRLLLGRAVLADVSKGRIYSLCKSDEHGAHGLCTDKSSLAALVLDAPFVEWNVAVFC